MNRAGWTIDDSDGLTLVRCDALSRLAPLAHGFSTRLADGGEIDLAAGGHAGRVLRRRFLACCGVGAADPALARQVHGDRVVRVGRSWSGGSPPQADGLLALRGDSAAPAVRTADCVPLLLADRDGRGVAAVHAGWRGTALAIAARAVEGLGEMGLPPARLVAAIGPAIGGCCYEVGAEVMLSLARWVEPRASLPAADGKSRVDLAQVNRRQLEQAGVRPEAIHAAPWCTACAAPWFYSFRREGVRAGRMMACIGWRAADRPGPA